MSFRWATAVLLASILVAACSETPEMVKQGRWSFEAATEPSIMGHCKLNGIINFDNLDIAHTFSYERNIDGHIVSGTAEVPGYFAANLNWADENHTQFLYFGTMARGGLGTDFEWGTWNCAADGLAVVIKGNWIMRKLPESTGIMD